MRYEARALTLCEDMPAQNYFRFADHPSSKAPSLAQTLLVLSFVHL